MNYESRRLLSAATKRLSFLRESKIRENLEMMGADLVEAYKAGAEEAQEQIIARMGNVLTIPAATFEQVPPMTTQQAQTIEQSGPPRPSPETGR